MSSPEESNDLVHRFGRTLLEAARAGVEHAVRTGGVLDFDLEGSATELRAPAATFVSLHRGDDLLGCIGSLSPKRPLIVDVVENAAAAVLRDPRCPVLRPGDVPDIRIDISLLTPSEPLEVASEADLIAKLRPGIDGVTLEDHGRRGTFLPVVWESVPDPEDFVYELKRKAGLPTNGWSPSIRVSRYRTVTIRDDGE
jgi:AmmeMemoRadiSam system protein A